jgi:hypothetical protein
MQTEHPHLSWSNVYSGIYTQSCWHAWMNNNFQIKLPYLWSLWWLIHDQGKPNVCRRLVLANVAKTMIGVIDNKIAIQLSVWSTVWSNSSQVRNSSVWTPSPNSCESTTFYYHLTLNKVCMALNWLNYHLNLIWIRQNHFHKLITESLWIAAACWETFDLNSVLSYLVT